ncbi:hypothetical protein SLE2022_175620 [Rubroshorea leprosula]
MFLSMESSHQNIPQEEGECVDVKLTTDKIWILKDNGLVYNYLLHTNTAMEEAGCYVSQEEFVADQLFQSLENSADDLILMANSVFSSGKEHIFPLVSSIFLRRLLHPGVLHNLVLRATLIDYNKHWTDSEFQSLIVDGLKKEILLLVEDKTLPKSVSIFQGWKNFCRRYFHYWCRNNAPCSLIVGSSSGAVGLIRKSSVSLFRGLENIELLIDGSREELGDLVLETGHGSIIAELHVFNLGADVAWEKEQADHKNLRKFSVDILLSLHVLYKKAASWEKVFDVLGKYLQVLVPQKVIKDSGAGTLFNISNSIVVPAVCQIAKVMFESALDILLFVSYLVDISWQIDMSHHDISKIQLEMVPMIQEIVFEWLIVLFFSTTPSESLSIEDFSSQLSSLHIGSNTNKKLWNEKLGKPDFTLASILLPNIQSSSVDERCLSLGYLPNPHDIISMVQKFTSWIIFGKVGDESPSFLRRSITLSLILLRHGQYDALKFLLSSMEANSERERIFKCIQDDGSDWCLLQHLLGCCHLAQMQCGLHGILKDRKVCEAVHCFFRASSGKSASQALQSLSPEVGLPYLGFSGFVASPAWKLLYYQWAMQLFEQYNISEGACQFALAALEQVDEALRLDDDFFERDPFNESATTIKGRLWANIFKFTLDLNLLNDAYCAIISNPDEESKSICLRRFIIVLYERGALKVLCDGQLPFIDLADKVEQELAWKAERSDVLAKPNPYKLLYAFEMHRHNWRRAANYIYIYSSNLRTELVVKNQQKISVALLERLNGLSAAINALNLVHPMYAWIDPLNEANFLHSEHYPSKKAKKTVTEESAGKDWQLVRPQFYIDTEKLENEFVLASAEYLLSLANVKWTYSGFSASTGGVAGQHTLKSWKFNSSLDDKETNENSSRKIKTVVAIAILVIVLLIGTFLAYVTMRQRKKVNKRAEAINLTSINDDFEMGTGPRRFSYQDLASATNDFSQDRKLGEGGFGAVYKGYLADVDMLIAVKKISKGSKQGKKEYIAEVKIISTFGYLAPVYISTRKASKESDVSSFGVVILEIATRRRSTYQMGEESDLGLVEWVWDLYGKGRLHSGVDERVRKDFDEKQAECLMIVGMWCSHPDSNLRPSIRLAIYVLKFEAAMPNLPAKMPVPMYRVPTPLVNSREPSISYSSIEVAR